MHRRLSAEFGNSIIPIAMEANDEDDFVIADEDMRFSEERNEVVDHEKVLIKEECELIVLMSRIKGRLEVTSNSVSFVDLLNTEDNHDFKFNLAHLKEIHLRKFNLRRSAMELFLVDRKSYFINLKTKTRNKVFSKILSLQPPNIQYGSGRAPIELLKSSGLTQKWVNREISNFDYLMHLNTIAGRSYMDLAQYPIFPWILADYTSDTLDLTDPKTFRDLSKPIGVANPKNEAEVRNKYENFEDPTGAIPKFHYGTHYSNSAGVLHYLLRIEPFTSLHVELQSGRFDVADRQFQSIGQTWKQLMDSPNDVKELIPEFFYSPDFLRNVNRLDLGVNTNTKERVDDVILPPWAHSPEDFISIHRRALECEHVSRNLHSWIDLIFGYKQKGPKAAEALNVFYYCTYEGAVDLDKIASDMEREAVEGMINNFGQTPSQLMREPHPKRISPEEQFLKILKNDVKRVDMIQFLDRVSSRTCEMASDRDPVVFLSQPRTVQRGFLQSGPDVVQSISKSGILNTHHWQPFDKERKGFLFENDSKTSPRQLIGPFHPKLKMTSSLFAVNTDGKLLYAGGIWDGSLKVFSIGKGKTVASCLFHKDVITCLATDSCGMYLVTGSRDCTSVVWSISNTNLTQNSLGILTQSPDGPNVLPMSANNVFAPQPQRTLYGHDKPVTSVAIQTDLDLVVSGSQDGQVNMYCIESGQLVRRVRPVGCTGVNIEVSFVTINYQGHVAFSVLDDTSFSVHVYSINGSHLGSKYVSGRVTNLSTMGDHLIVADDAGDITISRLNSLKPVFDIPLHIPIETVVVTPGNSHILAAMRDGSLAVVGIVFQSHLTSPINSFMSRQQQHSIQTV